MGNLERETTIGIARTTRDEIAQIASEARKRAPFQRRFSRIIVPNKVDITIEPIANAVNSYNIEVEMKEQSEEGQEGWTQLVSCQIDDNGQAKMYNAQRRNGKERDRDFIPPSADVVLETVRVAGNKRTQLNVPAAFEQVSETAQDCINNFFTRLGSRRYIMPSPEVMLEHQSRLQNKAHLSPVPEGFIKDLPIDFEHMTDLI